VFARDDSPCATGSPGPARPEPALGNGPTSTLTAPDDDSARLGALLLAQTDDLVVLLDANLGVRVLTRRRPAWVRRHPWCLGARCRR